MSSREEQRAEFAKRVEEREKGMDEDVVAAHRLSSDHRDAVMKSRVCGCFYCLGKFNPGDIIEWIDRGQTAICPLCGIDSVLGDNNADLSNEFLEKMHKAWFATVYVMGPGGEEERVEDDEDEVSEPDFKTPEEAREFMERVQEHMREMLPVEEDDDFEDPEPLV